MARNELPVGLLNPENILPASFSPEKEFAGFVTTKKKDLELHYEPKRFEYEYEGFTQSTKPDFLLINLLTGVETYIEITLDDMRDDYDPKARQKKVMHMGHPNVRYFVLYGEQLRNIQRMNPELDFFRNFRGQVT